MKKQSVSKLLVVLMALLIGFSSDSPIVVCLGEDGHLSIQMAFHSTPTPLPMQLSQNPDTPCKVFKTSQDEIECGNCYDLLIYNGSFIQDSDSSSKRLRYQASRIPGSFSDPWLIGTIPQRLVPNSTSPPVFNPTVDSLIKPVVLLI